MTEQAQAAEARRQEHIAKYGMCPGSFAPIAELKSREIGQRYYYGLFRERLWQCPDCNRFFPKCASVPWDGSWILRGHEPRVSR